jgi:phosphoglycolate phosphatase-like HAD superfamily hydrolase
MKIKLKKYQSILFDCDGVVLNSNRVKTEAFGATASYFGKASANAFVEFHVRNGGISRYAKFDHFIDVILPAERPDYMVQDRSELKKKLLAEFAVQVKDGLMNCDVAVGLRDLRCATPDVRWFIVSGGDQEELREVFARRGLADYFDGGVYGSPSTKYVIIEQLLHEKRLDHPTLFLGDSRLDYEVAKAFEMDFFFISEWTELNGWQEYVATHDISAISKIGNLVL